MPQQIPDPPVSELRHVGSARALRDADRLMVTERRWFTAIDSTDWGFRSAEPITKTFSVVLPLRQATNYEALDFAAK